LDQFIHVLFAFVVLSLVSSVQSQRLADKNISEMTYSVLSET